MNRNMEDIQGEAVESLPSSPSSGTRCSFGDPDGSPRVGDEYQVEVPPLMTKDELRQLTEEPLHLGLPIPVVWIRGQCESSKESHIAVQSECANEKADILGSDSDDGKEIAGDGMEIDLGSSSQEKSESLIRGYDGCLPVPGLAVEAWNDIECGSFTLGLYIFGKNLTLVKKFVGSKGMGEILSYYHGKFYKSSEYNRWLDCRKKKKRCAYGERIFTSWRQQELMTRLSSNVSEECKTWLIEASRIFEEGKMSLDEYVFALKDVVGLKALVLAVAIGEGKRDLTGLRVDHAKTSPSFPAHPEIQNGKSSSSLTVDETRKLLTGNARLSKARANDVFWEAVWPRLSENGWRLEEPRKYVSLSRKQSWVYVIPGVKKFSRRKLVKGTHYFDSISDVLNKVAMEPKLLDLEPDTTEFSTCKDEGRSPDKQPEQDTDGFSSRERHSYLQPRFSQEKSKFMVVDTTLDCGKEMAKVTGLRTLPIDIATISTTPAVSSVGNDQQSVITGSRSVVQENKIANGMEAVIESKRFDGIPSYEVSSIALDNHPPNDSDLIITTEKLEKQKQQRIPKKLKFRWEVESSQPNEMGSTTNKDKLAPCESVSISFDNVGNKATQCETFAKPSSVSSLDFSLAEKTEKTWIDFTLPHIPPNSDKDEPLLNMLPEFETSQQKQLNPSGSTVLTNGLRQSTRNRPLTTKALEALACGYLSPKKKRKGGETASQDNPMTKPPRRRVHAKTALLTSCGGSRGGNDLANHSGFPNA